MRNMDREDGPDPLHVLLIVLTVCVCFYYLVNFIGRLNQETVVSIDGKEMFRGIAVCVEVKSAGAATSVDIGIPCRFPGIHYTDKNIKVVTE